jgi:multidrug efflux pump subunit AcrA (membrane-fusion protein)
LAASATLRARVDYLSSEMTERTKGSWLLYALGALCAGAIVAAVLLVGPSSSSQASVTRTAKAAQGVVQSTVSGSGNLQAASQLNLGFKTAGTVTHIYVSQGQHVVQGQLLAALDPQTAEVTLEQSKASLQSAEANLAKEEETDGEGSTAAGSSAGSASAASVSYAPAAAGASVAHAAVYAAPGTPTDTTNPPASTTPASTTPASTTPTSTSPTSTAPTGTPRASTPSTSTGTTTTRPTSASGGSTTGTSTQATHDSQSNESASGTTSAKATTSAATREANLASARAAVRSEKLTVQSDEQAVQDTRLYAPESGTIVSLSGQVGEVVSGSGTTKASSSTGSSSSSGASATGASAAAAAGRTASGASSDSSGSSGSSSSSAFAVLSNLSSMQLVVALSESEIIHVKAGQIATVTVEALEGRKLAAHVSEVAIESTSSSGAVSYDVTFQLNQMESGLKPGMSATAEVVIKQAEGVNVPTSAISAGQVTVERNGKQVRQRVVTGLAGNSSTIIVSGLQAGETVVLPAASTTSSSATNLVSKFAGRAGLGGAGAGGAGGFAGAGGGAFFRGGG